MLLGKRPRRPIQRTASMSGLTDDQLMMRDVEDQEPSDFRLPPVKAHATATILTTQDQLESGATTQNMMRMSYNAYSLPPVSPRNLRSSSGRHDYLIETSQFLHTCRLCNCYLAPGRDIYMYKGDTAFCSLECREEQMKEDERKEKCKNGVASMSRSAADTSSSGTTSSTKTQTVATA